MWIATDAGTLVQLDQETAAVQWTWKAPSAKLYPGCLTCIGEPTCVCPLLRSTPAITEDGGVIIGSYDRNVYKFDFAGNLLWTFATGGVVYAPVTLDDAAHAAYVGSWDGYLYALDEQTGKELWKFKVGSNGDCSVAVGEAGSKYANTVVIGSNEGGTCDGLGLCFVFAVDKVGDQPRPAPPLPVSPTTSRSLAHIHIHTRAPPLSRALSHAHAHTCACARAIELRRSLFFC